RHLGAVLEQAFHQVGSDETRPSGHQAVFRSVYHGVWSFGLFGSSDAWIHTAWDRFVGSLHDVRAAPRNHEPTPNLSRAGSSTARPGPLLGGVRAGFVADRFMEKLVSLLRM